MASTTFQFNALTGKFDMTLLASSMGFGSFTDNMLIRADGADRIQDSGITIDDSDNITVPGLITGRSGTGGAPSYVLSGRNAGFYSDVTNMFLFSINGVSGGNGVNLRQAGSYINMGIGATATTNPTLPLEVKRTHNNTSAITHKVISDGSSAEARIEFAVGQVNNIRGRFNAYSSGFTTQTEKTSRVCFESGVDAEGIGFFTEGTSGANDVKFYTGGYTSSNLALKVDSNQDTTLYGKLITFGGTTTKPAIMFTNATSLMTTPTDGAMEYKDGHFYITNGARHAISTAAGVQTSTVTVQNTTTETTIYSYTFAANELHADQFIDFTLSGIYSNASSSDNWTIRFYVDGNLTHSISRSGGNVTNGGWRATYFGTVRTEGASGTFVDFAELLDVSGIYSVGETSTHSIDTTASFTFSATVQWDNAKAGNVFTSKIGRLAFAH